MAGPAMRLTLNAAEERGIMSGSYDNASPVEQMRAISLALSAYFGTKHWLTARRRVTPGAK